MKKLILIALAAGAAVLAKKQLDKSNAERAQWAQATDTVTPTTRPDRWSDPPGRWRNW